MILGNGKSLAVLLRKLRGGCGIGAGLLCLPPGGTRTGLWCLPQVPPEPLAKGESPGPVTPENISFCRSFWYLASIFLFYFLFLFERAGHLHGAFVCACAAQQWHDSSLTLAQLYAYKLPSSGGRTAVVLKESFKTPLGFWITLSVASTLWGNLLQIVCMETIFSAFTFSAAFAI